MLQKDKTENKINRRKYKKKEKKDQVKIIEGKNK